MEFTLILCKTFSFILLILVASIGAYIPIYIGNLNPTFIQYINVFAGGTLITLSLCHLLPEAQSIITSNDIKFMIFGVEVPIVFYLTLFGITLILFFEKALFSPKTVSQFHMHDHSFPHERDHHHHHSKDPGCSGLKTNVNSVETLESCEDLKQINIPLLEKDSTLRKSSKSIIYFNDNSQSDKENPDKFSSNSDQNGITNLEHKSSFNLYFLVSALSVHSIFEGILVGMSNTVYSVLTITLVIIAHKWVEGIAVSAGISKHPEISRRTNYQLLLSFILMSPLGIILGQIFSLINNPIFTMVIVSISAGALIYVALGEMILEEFKCGENRKEKFLLFFFGIILVSFISIIQHKYGGCILHSSNKCGHIHSHSYSHGHNHIH